MREELNGNKIIKKRHFGEMSSIVLASYHIISGKLCHAVLEDALAPSETSNEETEYSEDTAGYVESIQHVLDDISEVRAIESAVQHQVLKYVGIVDCVAKYR